MMLILQAEKSIILSFSTISRWAAIKTILTYYTHITPSLGIEKYYRLYAETIIPYFLLVKA